MRTLERLMDPLMWVWCWIALHALGTVSPRSRAFKWLLPFAGFYAYHERGLPWRWSERVR